MLLFGFFGFGKIMLVYIIVYEFGVNICVIFGFVIEKFGDFVVILINLLEEGDVLFIDEIYCLGCVVEEYFYFVMEDFKFDIVLG